MRRLLAAQHVHNVSRLEADSIVVLLIHVARAPKLAYFLHTFYTAVFDVLKPIRNAELFVGIAGGPLR